MEFFRIRIAAELLSKGSSDSEIEAQAGITALEVLWLRGSRAAQRWQGTRYVRPSTERRGMDADVLR